MPSNPAFGSAIGPIISAYDVEQWALATLRKWSSTYIGEAEAQHARVRGSLPRIRTYTTTNSFDKWPEDQLPCVLLVSPGTVQEPTAEGDGVYTAVFALGVAVIVSTGDSAQTEEIAKLMLAALRTCLVQQRSLGGHADDLEWLDETYDNLPSDDSRSLGAGQAVFAVAVRDLSRRYAGPPNPISQPGHPASYPPNPPYAPLPDDPEATDVQVVLQPLTE